MIVATMGAFCHARMARRNAFCNRWWILAVEPWHRIGVCIRMAGADADEGS
ncbi:MAG: hypothetical protein ACREFV_01610 [Acetobacteraceae bacterium]